MKDGFKALLAETFGVNTSSVLVDALGEAPAVSVRYNTAKRSAPEGERVPWNESAVFLSRRPDFTLDPLLHGGAYYVQDSSAMFVGHVFRQILPMVSPEGHLRILDLCAAPGGKTTDVISSLHGREYLLVSNEISPRRIPALCDNVARWGDDSTAIVSADPAALGRMTGFFDVVLADVPCSGEGMFRKDPDAVSQWSLDNVALCQARQRRIISDVWPSLREGGMLIYSTCTFNHLENDDNVRWVLQEMGAELIRPAGEFHGVVQTEYGYALLPGFVRGEGQYCAVLRKTVPSGRLAVSKNTARPCAGNIWLEGDFTIIKKGEYLCALPKVLFDDAPALDFLHPLRTGVAVGSVKGKDFVPHADLALARSLSKSAFQMCDVPYSTAITYLRRDAIRLDSPSKGYIVVTYEGLPLGFVKNLGGRCNNLLPQGRRVRKNL